jgi:hypothetical protein
MQRESYAKSLSIPIGPLKRTELPKQTSQLTIIDDSRLNYAVDAQHRDASIVARKCGASREL